MYNFACTSGKYSLIVYNEKSSQNPRNTFGKFVLESSRGN